MLLRNLPAAVPRTPLSCSLVVSHHRTKRTSACCTCNTATADVPQKCKRLLAQAPSPSFKSAAVLTVVDIPRLEDKELLVKVTHVGINGGCETFRARAEFAFSVNSDKEWFPLGAEGSGTVVAVGSNCRKYKAGDAVAFTSGGAFSEYVVLKPPLCTPVDQPSAEATALIVSGTTACAALEVTGQVQADDTVLVTAAAGGTGHFAVQLAKLAGSHVIATCGGPAKAAALRSLGVDRVIDYMQEDVGEVLKREYPGGVSLVYEGVGGSLRQVALANLAEGGRLLQVGYISEYPHTQAAPKGTRPEAGAAAGPPVAGSIDEVPAAADLFWGNQDYQWGSRRIIGSIWPKNPKLVAQARKRIFRLHQEGKVSAWVDRSHSFKGLGDVPDAVAHMLKGQHIGKVVVPL